MKDSIKKLLASEERRAIIPGFGAIQALRDNEGTSLSFNKYLNFDDGKLSSLLASAKGISTEEASALIADCVKDMAAKIENGEAVSIDGIGSFASDGEGSISFAQADDYSDAIVSEEPLQFAPASDDVEPNSAEPSEAEANMPEEAELPNFAPPSNDNYEEEKPSKKWLLILLILLLLLLLIFGILFIHKDNAVYRFFFGGGNKPATEQVVEPVKEEPAQVKEEPAAPAPEQTQPEPAKVAKPEPTVARQLDKRYNIIVGSYRDEAVAIKRIQDLQSKGFNDAFVGIRKDFYVAVIGSFSKLTEAERMQEQIVDGPYHIESWITNSGE